jgi:iron complex outermembrane receptor protein
VVAGLQGEFGDSFTWEAGAQYSEQRITSISNGYMRAAGLDQAVTTGVVDLDGDGVLDPINLFDPIPQQVVDAIRAEPRTDGLSSITSVDFVINGEMFEMPTGAGPAQFAVVAEFARQRFEDRRDPDVLAGNIEGLGGSSGGGDRKYQALGVELEVPIFDQLTLNLAGRYDNYDDASAVGGAFSPRIALQYRPIDTLLLRASAGESFRAPDLQRLFGAETTAFDDLIDTPTCLAMGGQGRGIPIAGLPAGSHDPCVDAVQSTEIRTGANQNLTEETGENANLGVVWEALPGLSLSADFWYIKLEDIVNTPTEQFILDQNAASGTFADAITRDTVGCDPSRNVGCLDIVSSIARNLSFQRARGVDATFQYLLNTGAVGNFTFKLGGTYLDTLEIQELPGDPVINVLSFGELGEFVRFKGNAQAGWSLGPWTSTLFVNYIGPFTPDDPTLIQEVGSYTTVNLSGSWTAPWDGTIHLGINNLLDKEPPFDLSDGDNSQPFYNQFFHDPFGMTWWASYVQRF